MLFKGYSRVSKRSVRVKLGNVMYTCSDTSTNIPGAKEHIATEFKSFFVQAMFLIGSDNSLHRYLHVREGRGGTIGWGSKMINTPNQPSSMKEQ